MVVRADRASPVLTPYPCSPAPLSPGPGCRLSGRIRTVTATRQPIGPLDPPGTPRERAEELVDEWEAGSSLAVYAMLDSDRERLVAAVAEVFEALP